MALQTYVTSGETFYAVKKCLVSRRSLLVCLFVCICIFLQRKNRLYSPSSSTEDGVSFDGAEEIVEHHHHTYTLQKSPERENPVDTSRGKI
jgi:hypothetical protein